MAVEQRHVATQVLTCRRRGGALRNLLILEGTAPAFEYDAVWSVLALYAKLGNHDSDPLPAGVHRNAHECSTKYTSSAHAALFPLAAGLTVAASFCGLPLCISADIRANCVVVEVDRYDSCIILWISNILRCRCVHRR